MSKKPIEPSSPEEQADTPQERENWSPSAAPSSRRCAKKARPIPTISGASISRPTSLLPVRHARQRGARSSPGQGQDRGPPMLKRVMGKASFATIRDMTGAIRLLGRMATPARRRTPRSSIATSATLSGWRASCFRTRTGELTLVRAHSGCSRSRCAHCRRNGTASPTRKRVPQRYVDLIMNEDTRRVFQTRSRIVNAIRES